MRQPAVLLLSLVACSLAVACGDASDSADDTSGEDALLLGSVDTADPSVGMLAVTPSKDPNAPNEELCVGTLIAPTVVLTSAICASQPLEGFYTGAGAKADNGFPVVKGLVRYAIAAVASHPAAPSGLPGLEGDDKIDIGLVELAKPVKSTPIPYPLDFQPNVGVQCKVVGYGLHGLSLQQKRFGIETLDGATTNHVQATLPGSAPNAAMLSSQGDRGAPLLCNGALVGPLSWGGVTVFHQHDHFTRVGVARDFIASTLASWNVAAK